MYIMESGLISFWFTFVITCVLVNCSEPIYSAIKNKTIEDFKEYCPYTDLCYANTNKSYAPVFRGLGRTVPCCLDCSCKDGCGKECCPDKPDSYLTDKEIKEINKENVQCVPAQYKTFFDVGVLYNRAFQMVSSCPPHTNKDFATKCTRAYQDFDLEEDLQYFGPITSGSVTFKNKYCAKCNNASIAEDDTTAWTIGVQCLGQSKSPPFNSFLDLISMVRRYIACDVIFIPVSVGLAPKRCSPLVDRCNITGHWEVFDADVERACMSYTSLFNTHFKNVHCYMCNKRSGINIVNTSCNSSFNPVDLNVFVTLLDFRGLQKSKTNQVDVSCPLGYIYYPFQKRCRHLICPDYMYVDNGTCKSLKLASTTSTYYQYSVTFALRRRTDYRQESILRESIGPLYEDLWKHITLHLERRSSNFSLCHLDCFIVLKDKITDEHIDLSFRNELPSSLFDYFAFRVVIGGAVEGLLSSELQVLATMFKDVSESSNLSSYSICYKTIPNDLYSRAVHSLRNLSTIDDYIRNPTQENPSFRFALSNALMSYLFDKQYGLHIGPLPVFSESIQCPYNTDFLNNALCPNLMLAQDEFVLTDDGIVINDIDILLYNYEISFTFNDSALICIHSISHLIGNIHTDKPSKFSSLDLFTIVCLSLSLISLGLTFSIYLSIKQLRSLPGLNIMALIVSLFVTHLLTIINGVFKSISGTVCIVAGVTLHLALLLSMLWMFICTFHMARVFISLEKLNPRDTKKYPIFFRYALFTVVISILLVSINIAVSVVRSNGERFGYDDSVCYIESLDMILYTVAIPLGAIVLSNICMFVCVIVKLSRLPSMKESTKNDRNYITIFAKLSTITGVTYIFIFLYQLTEIEMFSFIFILLNASQGVFIFLAFVCNRRILNIIKKSVKDFKLSITSTKDSGHSHSITHQTKL